MNFKTIAVSAAGLLFANYTAQKMTPNLKYPETKKQIDDFRNHICLFLGMTKPNVNFNDVDNLVTGLNIMFKMTTNIITRNYIYENYKSWL